MRAELAEATESLAMAKSLFARAAQANDLEEQLKACFVPRYHLHGPVHAGMAAPHKYCAQHDSRCQVQHLTHRV